MNKQEYQRYLQSAHWKQVKRRKLDAVSSCEWAPIEWEHPKHGPMYGDPCGSTKQLEVHHLTYENLGREKDEDLEVLCRFHHLVRHAMYTTCWRCGEGIEAEEEDAIAAVKDAIDVANGDLYNVDFELIKPDDTCDYCEHIITKDD